MQFVFIGNVSTYAIAGFKTNCVRSWAKREKDLYIIRSVNFIRINLHNLGNALFDFENFSFQFLFITLSASSFDVSFLTRKLIIMLSKSVNS